MGLFEILFGRKKTAEPARIVPEPPAPAPDRYAWIKQTRDPEVLREAALTHAENHVRYLAIQKLKDPETLLEAALRETYDINRKEAVGRFCQLGRPEDFFPMAKKLGVEPRAISAAAEHMETKALQAALRGTEDAELIRMAIPGYVMGLIDSVKQRRDKLKDACNGRLRELETLNAQRQAADLSTDAERAAFAMDKSRPAEARADAVRQMTDEALLAEILKSANHYAVADAAADRIGDAEVLAAAAEGADRIILRHVYPKLMERCARYTPEYVAMDPRAESEVRKAALERVEDQRALLELALNGPSELRVPALARMTDRDGLARVADGDGDIHLRWLAAWRAGDDARMKAVESAAEKRINGHAVIVTAHSDWERHEEMCIRCGAVYGHEEDSESSRHYGKTFASIPCRPEIPQL